jgi:hypothetical protein
MLLLLTNGILQMEWVQAPFEVVGVNFLGGAILLMGFALPRRLRKRWRLLPGLLIALGGFAMYWTTRGETQWVSGNWPWTLFGTGIAAMVFGLSQVLLDTRGWVKLSPRSMRIKRGLLPMQRIEWARVQDLYVEDGRMHMMLKNGGSMALRLDQGNSQTMKSRIDQIFREARSFQRNMEQQSMAGVAP